MQIRSYGTVATGYIGSSYNSSGGNGWLAGQRAGGGQASGQAGGGTGSSSASGSDTATLTARATALLDRLSGSGISGGDETTRASFAALNSIMAQLSALAPESGNVVSAQIANTIQSLNSRASDLARSLGIAWTAVVADVGGAATLGVTAAAGSRQLDIMV
ncbi:hypothetical protein GALL_271760 [mine drainage metagenome]|uniref:Uncharacterized protein n=1 Tax=mine drainage metagenome TaxID=410659 RepID=A0A1J5R4P0_9ZZZZ